MRVKSQNSPFGVCDGQNGSRAPFFSNSVLFLPANHYSISTH
jgi:hypothetical protein